MKIILSNATIDNISLDYLAQKYKGDSRKHLNSNSGMEHHKLLAYLSTLFNNILIADIGTRTGNSALAISHNVNNNVDSYDIMTTVGGIDKDNLSFHCKDILEDPKILEYSLISLDVDPHDAKQESSCLKYLEDNSWKGILILDDIGPDWPHMNNYWNSIELPKWDITKYGHASGTGLVDFSGNLELEML